MQNKVVCGFTNARQITNGVNYCSRAYARIQLWSRLFEGSLVEALEKHLQLEAAEKVLDVGCNRGAFVKRMRQLGMAARGVDVNREALSDALCPNLSFMDATKLEFANDTFDKLYSLHTIEHIPDIEKALSEMARVLRPGGRMVLTYPIEPSFLRGLFCVHQALMVYKSISFARKIHVHSVHPWGLKRMIRGKDLEYVGTYFPVPLYPQYFTVLRKPST